MRGHFWGLFCLVLLFGASFPPLSNAVEMNSQEIIFVLNTNLTRQLELTEQAWNKYLISDENWRQEKSLSLTLDQIVKRDSVTISNMETLSSKQESSLMKVSYFSRSLEEDLMTANKKVDFWKKIGIGGVVLSTLLTLILIF